MQLSNTVKWWLDHPKELTAKASAGQQWALHNVLTNHFFEQVTELCALAPQRLTVQATS